MLRIDYTGFPGITEMKSIQKICKNSFIYSMHAKDRKFASLKTSVSRKEKSTIRVVYSTWLMSSISKACEYCLDIYFEKEWDNLE